MKPDELIKESLETFLRHKLKVIESELFLLYKAIRCARCSRI